MENISNKMGELIKINVNDEGKQLVSARELHNFLGINSNFTTWFNRMCEYGFMPNTDYIEVWSDSKNGNVDACSVRGLSPNQRSALGISKDYAISIDMAKEISMIQRTDKGKQARQYFIACEKKLKEQPKNLSPLDQLALQRDAILQVNEKQQQFESRLTKIENNSTIDYSQQEHLRELANKVVVQALGGNEAPAYKELGKKAFSSLWNEYKRILKVNSYKNTLVKNYEKGIEFISNWKPTKELKYTIEGCNAQIRM